MLAKENHILKQKKLYARNEEQPKNKENAM